MNSNRRPYNELSPEDSRQNPKPRQCRWGGHVAILGVVMVAAGVVAYVHFAGRAPSSPFGPFVPSATYTRTPPPPGGPGKQWPSRQPHSHQVSVSLRPRLTGIVTPYHFGINLPAYVDRMVYTYPGVARLKAAGFKFLRFPGGSVADLYIWNKDYAAFPLFQNFSYLTADSKMDTDVFIRLCKDVGAEPIVQINFAAFVTNGKESGTKLAVDWLKHFRSQGLPVRFWEFGDENMAPWEFPTSRPLGYGNVTGALYGEFFEHVSQAMRAEDPAVSLGAVVADHEGGDGTGERGRNWMRELVPHLQGSAGFANLHSYFYSPTNWSVPGGEYNLPTSEELYSYYQAPLVQERIKGTEAIFEKYSPGLKLPIALTEWNIDQAFPHADGIVNEHISAFIVTDIMMRSMANNMDQVGFAASCYFSYADTFRTTGNESRHNPGPGDLGIIALGDNTTADNTPRPAWYAFALLKHALGEHLREVSHDGGGDVSVFASTFSSGEVGIIVINRRSVSLDLNILGLEDLGVSAGSAVHGWMVTSSKPDAPDPARARGSCWNEECSENKTKVGGPFPIEPIHPYISETAEAGQPTVLHLPAVSLCGTVFYGATKEVVA